MRIKLEAEKDILQRLKFGNCYFQWDNQTGKGPLHNLELGGVRLNNVKVASFKNNGNRDILKLTITIPSHLILIILQVFFQFQDGINDQTIQKLSDCGEFTCSFVWDIIRDHREVTMVDKYTWRTHVPFKWSFQVQRALRRKHPTNE